MARRRAGKPMQLTFDGGEVEVTMRVPAPFTPAQREILRLVRIYGVTTPTAAGRIVHAHREGGCAACRLGECRWASSDGWDAIKRLRERGMLRKLGRGRYVAVSK